MLIAEAPTKYRFIAALAQNQWVMSIRQEFTYIDPIRVREKNLLFSIEAAESRGKVVSGIAAVWNTPRLNSGTLLVAERDYLFPNISKRKKKMIRLDPSDSREMSVRDAVDITVEHVLQEGGSIEYVVNGKLRKYKRLVLVQQD